MLYLSIMHMFLFSDLLSTSNFRKILPVPRINILANEQFPEETAPHQLTRAHIPFPGFISG